MTSRLGVLVLLGLAACGDASDDALRPPDEPAPSCAGIAGGAWEPAFALPGLAGEQSVVVALARGGGGELYAGGRFTDASGVAVANVAVHDGAGWAPLGDGFDADVRSLAVDASGDLYATTGTALTRWDGTTWTEVVTVTGPYVGIAEIAFVDGALIVGGDFTAIGGVTARGLARFDGATWTAIGDLGGAADSRVGAIADTVDGYCVGGTFTAVGGVAADNVACWDGVAWTALGAGMPPGVDVLARAPDDTWYAGGYIDFVIGEVVVSGIAVLGDGSWRPLDAGGLSPSIDCGTSVHALAFDGDDLLIGGTFRGPIADELRRDGLVRVTPSGAVPDPAVAGWVGGYALCGTTVHAILPDGDGFVIAGSFATAGDALAGNVAVVAADHTASALPTSATTLGTIAWSAPIAAHGDALLLGGPAALAGVGARVPLARLDDDVWSALALDTAAGLGYVDEVFSLGDGEVGVAYNGDTVVLGEPGAWTPLDVGDTVTAGVAAGGGVVVLSVLRYCDGGSALCSHVIHGRGPDDAFTTLGEFHGLVFDLAWRDGALLAVGDFDRVDDLAVDDLAEYADGAWRASTLTAPPGDSIAAIEMCSDGAIAVTAAPDGDATQPYVHDGTDWQPLGEPRLWFPPSLALTSDRLFVMHQSPTGSALEAWAY